MQVEVDHIGVPVHEFMLTLQQCRGLTLLNPALAQVVACVALTGSHWLGHVHEVRCTASACMSTQPSPKHSIHASH